MSSLPAVVRDRGSQENFDALNTRQPSRDFGKVTALPSAALVGDTCYFKAAEGIYWNLLYTKESAEYPWNKIGGPPLYSVGANTEWSDTSVHATTAEITAPLAMEFVGDFGLYEVQNQSGLLTGHEAYFYVNGVSKQNFAVATRDQFDQQSPDRPIVQVAVEKAKVINVRVKNGQTNKSSYRSPFLRIDPIRVG